MSTLCFQTVTGLELMYLPPGVFDCTWEELTNLFGNNQRRRELLEKFSIFLSKLRSYGIEGWVVIDGSFVTSKETPGDIDILVVVVENENYQIKNPVNEIDRTLFNREYSKQIYELHVFVGFADNTVSVESWNGTSEDWTKFFQRITIENPENPLKRLTVQGVTKGVLRIQI